MNKEKYLDEIEDKIRTIGVLTSGGDAPGMNAAIRAVVRRALAKGLKVRGIRRGYHGLLKEEIIDLTARDVSDTDSAWWYNPSDSTLQDNAYRRRTAEGSCYL